MVARHWSSSRLSCGKRHLLRCDGNAGNSFPTTQRKDASSRARRRKRGPSGCGRDSRTCSRVETGISGNFLRYIKGVMDPLDVPEVKCDLPGDASAEMGLISLEGRTSWIFSSCGRCCRVTTGTSGTRSGGLRKGQSPCELLGGLPGFLTRPCQGIRPCVESVLEPEDSSPVLTWILGYFWSLPRGVSPRLDWGHASAISSRAVAAVSCFPSLGSRDLCFPSRLFSRLSHQANPQCCPTYHRGVS